MEKIITITTIKTNDPSLVELFGNEINPGQSQVQPSPDTEEVCDDVRAVAPVRKVASVDNAMIAEAEGLVLRARIELIEGKFEDALMTLGRISDCLNTILVK